MGSLPTYHGVGLYAISLLSCVCGVDAPIAAMTRRLRIYNEQTGSRMEIAFKFKWNSTHGQTVGSGPSGKPFDGEYSIGGVALGWGQIYCAE